MNTFCEINSRRRVEKRTEWANVLVRRGWLHPLTFSAPGLIPLFYTKARLWG